jgi:hypothetical protein
MSEHSMSLLVGDNPFHGISHLSPDRARSRHSGISQENVLNAARLVKLSLENGANGFMFSVDEVTLSILKILRADRGLENVNLYAIVPYAYEYVRRATQAGGVSGLGKSIAKEMIFSSNVKVLLSNTSGLLRFDPSSLLRTYVAYEMARIKDAAKNKTCLKSILLHEIITDMALALNLEELFESYIKFVEKSGVRPGFETRNFAYLVNKFSEWNIDFSRVTITSSFNKIGFQMDPSKTECERALDRVHGAEVIAMSVLAAGYLKPAEAATYLANLPKINGVVVGVSNERQSIETFPLLKQTFGSKANKKQS